MHYYSVEAFINGKYDRIQINNMNNFNRILFLLFQSGPALKSKAGELASLPVRTSYPPSVITKVCSN